MSTSKRQLDENNEYYNIAYEILKEIGAIEDCEVHEREWWTETGKYDKEQIYALATSILKRNYPQYNNFTKFHESIDQVLSDASIEDECPYCKKLLDE